MQTPRPYSVVSIFVIVVSVIVAAISSLGSSETALLPFLIANPEHGGLTDILHGEIWRLITPIFVHFGPMHLFFNMLWVWDLGKLMETRKGIPFYITFLVVVGIASNLAQYLLTGSPGFGGASGVVYGLLGFLWMFGRFHPNAGFAIRPNTIYMMLFWYVLCWTGLLGPIANWAHTAGLVIGVAWGFLSSKVFVKEPPGVL